MTPVVFDDAALVDLQAIAEWYESVAPEALSKILDDIYRSIEQLADFPLSGPAVEGENFRRIVTIKYGFKIAYEVLGNEVIVIGIFRYQNRER